MPMNSQPMRMTSSKTADGSTVYNCVDWASGGNKDHGSDWKVKFWHLKCNNGTVQVVSCLSEEGKEIPLGETVTIDGFWHKCIEEEKQVKYSQEPSCVVNGERLKIGGTFKSGNFQMKCTENGYDIAGCIFKNTNGKEVILPAGDSLDEGIYRHSCEKTDENKVTYRFAASACMYNGTTYQVGKTWISRNKEFECTEGGGISIKRCITDNGTKIEIGNTQVIGNIVHRCYKLGNLVYYHAYRCGDDIGVSCTPKPIPKNVATAQNQMANIPALMNAMDNGNTRTSQVLTSFQQTTGC